MMRGLVLLPLLLCIGAAAQNWALLNPAYKYNYSNDGSDTISNQIFVTHIDTLGVDSIRYELNRIGVVCPGCSQGYTSDCWNSSMTTDVVNAGNYQALGGSIRRAGPSWYIERSVDTLLFRPHETLGASWTGPGNILATVFNVTDTSFFGVADSLKHIAFTTGDTLMISLGFGLLYMRSSLIGSDGIHLVGVSGSLSAGTRFPSVLDLFDYQVGDELQYHDESQFQSSFCVHFVDGSTKYRVLDRIDSSDVTTYSMLRIFNRSEVSYYPQTWSPCGSQVSQGTELLSLVVHHETLTDANFFAAGLHGVVYPSALVFPEEGQFFRTLITSRLDSLDRTVIEPYVLDLNGGNVIMFCKSDQDTSALLPSNGGIGPRPFMYCEGIGLVRQAFWDGWGGNSRELVGYDINGILVGSVTPDGILLGVASRDEGPMFQVFPNPAQDHLEVLARTQLNGGWRIIGSGGQPLRTGRIQNDGRQLIDVSSLPQGIYVIEISTGSGRGVQRFVIAR